MHKPQAFFRSHCSVTHENP